jgi:hypothetical protein
MKVALIEVLQEARKWAAEKQAKCLEGITTEQLEAVAKRQEESEQIDEQEEEVRDYVYHPAGRNWVIYCMTNKLCSDGFTPDEAHLISVVAVNPEGTTPEEQEQASELKKRGPKNK